MGPSVASVDLPAVADADDEDDNPTCLNLVDDPVVADPEAVQILSAAQALRPGRMRAFFEEIDLGRNPAANVWRQPPQLLQGGRPE
jgi:hypothetical protein